MNKRIYKGIGLLVGGIFATIILFNFLPLLMAIGHVMVFAGFILLGRGIDEKKNGPRSSRPVNSGYTTTGATTQVKTEYCARCKKDLIHPSKGKVFIIDGEKYCAECKYDIEREIKSQHTVCSVCGVDLPIENMHEIDDALICHSCFLKKYGNIDFYDEE